ncbi:hypothetical protein A2753_00025 [Candidatus Uhrbacteria bacterium RIFCSPHIGHO2_01_FULL_47_11]|nr:MAG: hypothetical protein A2753_00025 [Candidatus Uhrbacteria bacterium RIFCSPHIGHO2_01_FULL_47_11]
MTPLHGKVRVSILMRAYNVGRFLPEALASIQAQDFQDWEVFVLDDHSPDDVFPYVATIIARDPRIHYVRNDVCLGRPANMNKGMQLARGEYIAVLDGDDYWCEPTKLSRQIDILDRHPDIVLVGGDAVVVDESGRQIIERCCLPWQTDEQIRNVLLIENIFPHNSVCFRRDTALRAGGYDESIPYAGDYELWLRLGQWGAFQKLSLLMCHNRARAGGISLSLGGNGRAYRHLLIISLRVIMRYRKSYPHFTIGFFTYLARLFYHCMPIFLRKVIHRVLRARKRLFSVDFFTQKKSHC